MRRQTWLLAVILLGAGGSWAAPPSSPPPDYRPLETSELCPALAEDYELCSDDLWSGNCADFVRAAGRLGEIYRSELRQQPGWVAGLQTTIWWGCGSAPLQQLGALLERIDTAQARAVLAEEPYRSLRQPRAPAPQVPGQQEPDCLAPSTQAERNACAARSLARAKAEHERLYAACRASVVPALRQELVDAETSWEKLLPLECAGADYTRDECLARAYRERTGSIVSMHPECDTPG